MSHVLAAGRAGLGRLCLRDAQLQGGDHWWHAHTVMQFSQQSVSWLQDEVDWDDFAFVMHSSEAGTIGDMLDAADAAAMRRALRKVKSRFTLEATVDYIAVFAKEVWLCCSLCAIDSSHNAAVQHEAGTPTPDPPMTVLPCWIASWNCIANLQPRNAHSIMDLLRLRTRYRQQDWSITCVVCCRFAEPQRPISGRLWRAD